MLVSGSIVSHSLFWVQGSILPHSLFWIQGSILPGLLFGFRGQFFQNCSWVQGSILSHSLFWVQGSEKTLVLREVAGSSVAQLLEDENGLAACDVAAFVFDRSVLLLALNLCRSFLSNSSVPSEHLTPLLVGSIFNKCGRVRRDFAPLFCCPYQSLTKGKVCSCPCSISVEL